MKTVLREDGGVPIKIWTDHVEDPALVQLKNLSRLPFIARTGVAVMPDVHAGIGSTVGSVIPTYKAVIPSAVGVDIGCGMVAVRLTLTASDLPDNLKPIRDQIERDVPLGGGGSHKRDEILQQNFHRLPKADALVKDSVGDKVFGDRGWEGALKKSASQLGTLGSGNHFIEVCLDESQNVWVMLHSGSRGIGNMIGSRYMELAKKRMEEKYIVLPDGDLAYLEEDTDDFNAYMAAVQWAQDYALENRKLMLELTLAALRRKISKPFEIVDEAIQCHHNYVTRETHNGQSLWITRKGAISAQKGQLGIIPGSMGQRSYIVSGKGNLEAYCSCSHGAGRAMSRSKAREVFTVDDLIAQTQGVECRKDNKVLDELPSGYKPIEEVMANQVDLVEVRHTLKQVICVKGT